MSYRTQAMLAEDAHLRLLVAACAATFGVRNPAAWAMELSWPLSAEPGWDAAYASALAAEVVDPGADESVISDGMILAAVQAIKSSEPGSPVE